MKITCRSRILQFWIIILLSVVRSGHQTVYSCNTSVSCGCSTNSAILSRIVGGESATSATWGWVVSISIADSSLCGGSIISNSWIITAAHCVVGYKASQVTVYAGSTVRFSGTQRRVASQIIVHSSYSATRSLNDIALLKLAPPLSMSDPYVSSICIPSVSSATLSAGEWPAANTTVVAIGWGKLNENGSLPLNLQQVTLQTVYYQSSTCRSSIGNWHAQLCAGVSGGGKGVCQGDSGGPLMMFTSSRQWVLVGLTSYGVGCAEAAYSAVYTRVAAYESWINSNTDGSISTISSSFYNTASDSTTLSTTTTLSNSTTRSVSATISTSTETTNFTASVQAVRSHADTVATTVFNVFIVVLLDFLATCYF